jgi:carbonic anhydrase/acetyltransferase-like protein (isoleucine patch superfamily)
VDPSCYVAPEAIIIGDVVVEKGCSIWPYAVIRADLSEVRIGEGSSIQEHCQIHGNPGKPTIIGKDVSVGHGAIIHAAKVGDLVVIGMNSCVLDDAKVPEGSLVVGVPGKIVRENDPTLKEAARRNAEEYHRLRDAHKRGEFSRYREA